MRFFQIIAISLLCLASVPAFAQETKESKQPPAQNLLEQLEGKPDSEAESAPRKDPLPRGKKKLFYDSINDLPDEAVAEAEEFFNECESNYHRASHYDCECLSMRFLEQRVLRGPNVPASIVMLDVRRECPNMPGAAGFAYTTCINQNPSSWPKNHDPEEYCSCVGNAYAKIFARSGRSPDSMTMMRLHTIATLSCTKQPPGVPRLAPVIR